MIRQHDNHDGHRAMSLEEDARSLLKMNPYDDVNAIRRAILSDKGPPKYGTRLVLVALLQFAGPGCLAWPSQKLIAINCGMTERSVRTHLQVAEQELWITRRKHRKPGKKWAQTYYFLHTPEQAANISARSVPIKDQPENLSPRPE